MAQILGVGRGDIDGDIAGVSIDLAQADQVVARRLLDRGVEILADVDAEDAFEFCALYVFDERIHAEVVEAHAVDDGLCLGQAEHARLGVARLRPRRDSADLDEAETQRRQRIYVCAILVQPGGQSERIGKGQPHHRARCNCGVLGAQQAKIVRGLTAHPAWRGGRFRDRDQTVRGAAVDISIVIIPELFSIHHQTALVAGES